MKSVSRDSFGTKDLLNILIISSLIGTEVKTCSECVQQSVMGEIKFALHINVTKRSTMCKTVDNKLTAVQSVAQNHIPTD